MLKLLIAAALVASANAGAVELTDKNFDAEGTCEHASPTPPP